MVARTADRRLAQHPHGDPGRHRLVRLRLLRLGDPDAHHRRAGGRRAAVHQLPRHADVFTHPGLSAHRPQQPQARYALHRGHRHRIPQLTRQDRPRRPPAPQPPAPLRLRLVPGRKVAPGPRTRSHSGRTVRQLAAAPRLRPLLRLHGRGHRSVRTRAVRGQPPGPASAQPRLPPLGRPGRPGHRLPARPPHLPARQPLLPESRTGCDPRTLPGTEGVHRALPSPTCRPSTPASWNTPTPSRRRERPLQRHPPDHRSGAGPPEPARRPPGTGALPGRLGSCRQHPLPPVQAVHRPRRRTRPAGGALAPRHHRPRRYPRAVRPRDRHRTDPPGRGRNPLRRGTVRRPYHRRHLRRCRGPRTTEHPALRNAGAPGASCTKAGKL